MRIKGKCLTCEMWENDDRESYRRGTYMFVVNITNSRRPEASVSSQFYFNTDELGTCSLFKSTLKIVCLGNNVSFFFDFIRERERGGGANERAKKG